MPLSLLYMLGILRPHGNQGPALGHLARVRQSQALQKSRISVSVFLCFWVQTRCLHSRPGIVRTATQALQIGTLKLRKVKGLLKAPELNSCVAQGEAEVVWLRPSSQVLP